MTQSLRTFSSVFVLSLVTLASGACGKASVSAAPAERGGGGRGGRGGDGGAVPVTTATVSQRDVPVDIAAIGNVEAFETVSVRSQVTGVVTEVKFHEGDLVRKGDLLFTIDPRPYQAMLEQAKANLSRDQALLAQAQAQVVRDQAQSDYLALTDKRNEELLEKGIVSKDIAQQSQSEAAANAAAVKADQAAVESARAQLGAQQAAVDNANVQLAYTVIRSPITGRTGTLSMKEGNLVTANSTELTTIAQIEPIFVTFSVPSAHLSAIRSTNASNPLPVVATPQDQGAQAVTGALAFIDNAVDTSTDTIKLKARFDNTNRQLWPGQFARVSLRLTTMPNATVVSNEAVQTGQDGSFVFVVKPDFTVEQRPVTVAQRINDDVVIAKGLTPGETIVTEGQLRLEPGTRIQRPGTGGAAPGAGGGDGAARGRGRRGGAAAGTGTAPS